MRSALLSRSIVPIKYSSNGLILCAYCIKIKNRSRRFESIFALTWHITHEHQEDIGIIDISDVSIPKTLVIKREFEGED